MCEPVVCVTCDLYETHNKTTCLTSLGLADIGLDPIMAQQGVIGAYASFSLF